MALEPLLGMVFQTRVLPAPANQDFGRFKDPETLETWKVVSELAPLHEAAEHLKSSSIPVGFPTETVYGLGADATRSDAVKGIYKAKGRPTDNPLIIHVSDLTMLRSYLLPAEGEADPIPNIYRPLIKRFWPGPLTILLPNPKPSKLAPEVTAGLSSFGARMPSSPLALSLIQLAGVPIAAPSANASTKPSPTTAEHVRYDLDGKIEIILDGGPCQVGVESTVVDGLCDPPVVLRPGGISIDKIRECKGWELVEKGYKDASEVGSAAPKAPGMKYKHYSPKAKVVLYEASFVSNASDVEVGILKNATTNVYPSIGIVRTKTWAEWAGIFQSTQNLRASYRYDSDISKYAGTMRCGVLQSQHRKLANLFEVTLGTDTSSIAHSLFSALRALDHEGVQTIYVEGVKDSEEGSIAEAVMNRLRKAATIIKT
ncbi:translation initiation protein-like protein Sua5 [Calycina marina]|uniref:Threonylcarbamoyl-AMP synthase n=1 Tax=Calycina marina TaxID=1763456 RepID=A0A9P8CHD6_9HELO|nr:translation initiation protein-like protein Sua5 [Calycina marina]